MPAQKNALEKIAPRKITPGNQSPKKIALRKNAPQENCPPSPKEKKRKLTPVNLLHIFKTPFLRNT